MALKGLKTAVCLLLLLSLAVTFAITSCDSVIHISQSLALRSRQKEIDKATALLKEAHDDPSRAAALSQRGRAYSEKARYSRVFKLIQNDEFDRLFAIALHDHDQAIALAPQNADRYFARGYTYYDRASVEVIERNDAKTNFERAAADFARAAEKDPRHAQAWDMLGLSHQSAGDLDKAIDAYSHEMVLSPFGKVRLADAHCERGSANYLEKRIDLAIADYEKSIELGATADGCSCEPYNSLVSLYIIELRNYDGAWQTVARALKAGKYVDPELLEKLKRESGRAK